MFYIIADLPKGASCSGTVGLEWDWSYSGTVPSPKFPWYFYRPKRSITPYHEQILYVPNRDCTTKYNLYLLYPLRPKSLSNNYTILINLYDKKLLNYLGSWHLSIPFQFLLVNRIATLLHIPQEPTKPVTCTLLCGAHGQCMKYINKNSTFFCHCDEGYSGTYCKITHQCNCEKNAICLSRSICICQLNKLGSRCYLKHPICQLSNNPCQHNGLCVLYNDRKNLTKFDCSCTEEYSSERCQYSTSTYIFLLDLILVYDIQSNIV
ncbi:hypothetical protein I4U23_005594 [Adineta vaga]|nr:hypothetical protein I4U23_005594 [Adineta vaga]